MKLRKFKRVFKINDLVDLRLVKKRTFIFINNRPSLICAFLENRTSYDWFHHIYHVYNLVFRGSLEPNETAEILRDLDLIFWIVGYKSNHYKVLHPKKEFQTHCSNVQAFFENGLKPDLLHTNILFPLLKELVEQGFEPARKTFKEEIAKRFSDGISWSRISLMKGGYLDYLNSEEKQALRYNEYGIPQSYKEWRQSTRLSDLKESSFFLIVKRVMKLSKCKRIFSFFNREKSNEVKKIKKNFDSFELILELLYQDNHDFIDKFEKSLAFLFRDKKEYQTFCSDFRALLEDGLNKDLYIVFPLLKELVEQGFEPARKILKEEIAKRFNEDSSLLGSFWSRNALKKEGYLDYLNSEEKQALRGYNKWMQYLGFESRFWDSGYLFKLGILGDSNVGRSSLIKKHLHNLSRLGNMNLAFKSIVSDEFIVKLQIWIPKDIFPSRKWLDKESISMSLNGARGVIIMYDITDAKSLNKISEWSQFIREQRGNIPILLVGNKMDLEEQREISYRQGMALREKYNMSSFIEISVETGENVEEAFEALTRLMIANSHIT